MKLNCDRAVLQSAFQVVGAVVPSRTPKPILQNSKLIVSPGEAVLIATDQEVGIRYLVSDVVAEGSGEILLPTSRMSAILRELRDEKVSLELVDEALWVRSGQSEFRLPVMNPAEFPSVAPIDQREFLLIPGKVLKEMIRRTLFATDPESTRYALGGILLETTPNRLGLVATDSRRLALVHAPCTVEGAQAARPSPPVVPAKAMSLIERSVPDTDEPVKISLQPNEVAIQSSQFTIYSRLLEGRFPKYQDVIPASAPHSVELVAGPFHTAVRQAQIVTSEESRGVDFNFTAGSLILKSQAADVGESRVELPISYSGDELTITFDPRFVADFLKVLGPETQVKLELTSSEDAAVLRTSDGYTYVIMPLSRDR
jgi:DNA polymerase III subunit beta